MDHELRHGLTAPVFATVTGIVGNGSAASASLASVSAASGTAPLLGGTTTPGTTGRPHLVTSCGVLHGGSASKGCGAACRRDAGKACGRGQNRCDDARYSGKTGAVNRGVVHDAIWY